MIYNMRRRKKKLYKWIFNEILEIGTTKTYYIVFLLKREEVFFNKNK